MAVTAAARAPGSKADSPVAGWRAAAALVPIVAQLALAVLVIRLFEIETRTFFRMFLLAALAFPVHALLPLRHRLAFFAALSLAGIALVFGLGDGAVLVGAGLLLIGACHLPVAFPVRIGAVVVLGALFGLARGGVVSSPIPEVVWPILGSMFMFRLAVYLHALRHEPGKWTVAGTLSYFFMLPNVCYPLYPVVDYTTFGRTHFDSDAAATYERGIKWIVRGLVHLLLYRFVYLRLTLDPSEVTGLGTLIQYLLTVFFLYLRISGQFHLIVGILHLFGFRLPETHRLFFLASSITDYWRRINIYWKDFMMKLVFYPSFFRLRKRSERLGLVVATMLVFVTTWALHSYQWFWLRAEFPVTPQDLLFWGVLGGLVVVTSLREVKRGRKRVLGVAPRRWNASLALRTAGTFAGLCVLWSLWSTDSLVDWFWIWSAGSTVESRDLAILGVVLALGLAIAGFVWDPPLTPRPGPEPFFRRSGVQSSAALVGLLVVGSPWLADRMPQPVRSVVGALKSPSLSRRDAATQHKGYYESLDDRGRLSAKLWGVIQGRPEDWQSLAETEAYLRRDGDFLRFELKPSTQVRLSGEIATINRWGMRDRDYAADKPPATRRVALLGPSHVMGMGVADSETFDAFLEERLNATPGLDGRLEVLNFGVAGYALTQQLRLLEERVVGFDPDVVVITDTRSAGQTVISHLTGLVAAGVAIPYPGLVDVMRRAGVEDFRPGAVGVPTATLRRVARMVGVETRPPTREIELRLNAITEDVVDWTLGQIARVARANGAVPIFLAMPNVTAGALGADTRAMQRARQAGFIVMDLYDLYEGQARDELRLAPWDNHPNARATRMIADRLYQEFQRHDAELGLGLVHDTSNRPRSGGN